MIRFVPWSEVGTIEVSPGDNVVEVGAFELAEGADTLWVRMTNTGTPGPWPWSYGILSFKTDEGQPLGSIKAYNSFDGEVFKLGVGLPPSVRAGVLTFEPRGFNMAWIKQGNPWSLKFEAQSGGGIATSGYWNRDSVDRVLSPATEGDDVHLGSGGFQAATGLFGPTVTIGDDEEIRLIADSASYFKDSIIIGEPGTSGSNAPGLVNSSRACFVTYKNNFNNSSTSTSSEYNHAIYFASDNPNPGTAPVDRQWVYKICSSGRVVSKSSFTATGLVLQPGAGDSANYVQQAAAGEIEEVYVGPSIDVLAKLEELQRRLEALEGTAR